MRIIPEKHSKKWVGRLILTTLLITIVFCFAFGTKIRGDIQSELIIKYAGMAATFSIINCVFGVMGLKRIYFFMAVGLIIGSIYLIYMALVSDNGAFQVVGFMSFVEFGGYGGLLGAIAEIATKIIRKNN